MHGIEVAMTGKLTLDPQHRVANDGKLLLTFNVLVDADVAENQFVNVLFAKPEAAELRGKLRKGSWVYVEGVLSLSSWTAKDGTERKGMGCRATKVLLLGLEGRRRPKDGQLGLVESNCVQNPEFSLSKVTGSKRPTATPQTPDDPIPF